MPLIVHCPNGCVFRVPRARAGTMVRCTECKSIIQLRNLTSVEMAETDPVEIRATLSSGSEADRSTNPVEFGSTAGGLSASEALQRMRNFPVDPIASDEPSDETASSEQGSFDQSDSLDSVELPIPRPARLRFNDSPRRRARRGKSGRGGKEAATRRAVTAGDVGEEDSALDTIQIDEDVFEFRSDDELRFLTQFFAACIGFMGIVLIVPSILAWGGWAALPVEPSGSRWVYIMIFLGALHVTYAVFLFQVPERSALWAVAIFLLIVGCIHGIFTVGTWLDAGSGPISRYLQLPPTETAAVTLWCFLHLCFSALLCYLCGRQALRWKQRMLNKSLPPMPEG